MSKSAFSLREVKRAFGSSLALRGIDMELPRRGLIGILGPSGCGKSTLLNILSGLDSSYAGSVKILGKEWKRMKERERRQFRIAHIGYVFQNFRLLELETAEGNVLAVMDALFQGKWEQKRRKVQDLLSFFGMEGKAKRKANTLSGGEKQRVALARALANDPSILLADEPTGALEAKQSEAVFSLLRRCAANRLVLVVSHDEELVRRYCDWVYAMKDGQITGVERCNEKAPRLTPPRSFLLPDKRNKPRLSLRFLLGHAVQSLKAKKWRSLISEAAISVGLSGLGLAVYVSSSISTELNAAFESLVPPNALIMMPRGGNDSPIGSVYGAGLEECEYIVEEYGDMVRDFGTDLHMDYESWFVDRNDFTFSSGVDTIRLDGFSMRSINDFQWFDLLDSPVCYPRTPAILLADQVVLGLPYQNMFTTCLNLRILRNYQSLGDYIDAHGLSLCLNIANYEWGFDDQELFTVAAVVESPVPCLYHLDHRWNRKIIIDQLRFRSSITEETITPQYVFEIPFLSLSAPIEEFLYAARRDSRTAHLIYERGGNGYTPTIYPNPNDVSEDRIYLYGADKSGVSFSALDECMALDSNIVGREPVTSGSYYAQTGSVAMGFAGKFYLCRNRETAENVVDAYSDLPLEAAFLPGEEIDGAKDGSYFGSATNGVRLSSDLSASSTGKKPKGIEECLLSRGLFEAWGNPQELWVAAEIGAEEVGSSYVRRFGVGTLKVVGVVDCDYDTFFVADDWTVDFYLSLGVSSFSLEPYGAVFSLKEGVDAGPIIQKLERAFPGFEFSNPAKEIASSIQTTLSYVGAVLMGFSFIALAMSGLLFFIVMTITVNENRSEAELFSILGVSESDVLRVYRAHGVIYASLATLGSVVMMATSSFLTQVYLAKTFNARLSVNLPFLPIVVVLLAGLVFSGIIMLGISINLRLKMSKNH